MSHTPGPWLARAVKNPNLVNHIGYAIDFNEHQEQVADFVYEKDDAYLIRAAPNLLAALKDVLRRIENSEHWWMDTPDRGGFDTEMIEAAIALATGEPK